MPKLRSFVAAACAALVMPAAFAQAPAVPVVAPHGCKKPEFPGKLGTESAIRRWGTDFKKYTDCLKAYIDERNAIIKANTPPAQAAIEEFNASVTEYNTQVKELN